MSINDKETNFYLSHNLESTFKKAEIRIEEKVFLKVVSILLKVKNVLHNF